MALSSPEPSTRLVRGTPAYRRTSMVLFAAGYMAFAMLYVAQGILPGVSRDFGVSPAAASLTLSLTTLPLAVAVLVAASWSEGKGRKGLLVGAVLFGAMLTLAASVAPSFGALLGVRILTGVVLAGLPAVAMAYVAEEFHPSGLGTAMGLYISGTGLGGMTGRLAGGLLASAASWRVAMAAVGGVCLAGGLWVALRLPPSHNFVAAPGNMRPRLARLQVPMRDPVTIRFALCGFVLMGSLVSFYNYLQYRLAGAPFNLSAALVALVFLLYLSGTVSANWMGMADRPAQSAQRAVARDGDHGSGSPAHPFQPAAAGADGCRGDGVRLLRCALGGEWLGQLMGDHPTRPGVRTVPVRLPRRLQRRGFRGGIVLRGFRLAG